MNSPIITIMTNQLEPSISFYRDVLGFTINSRIELPEVTLQFMQHELITVELVARKDSPKLVIGTAIILTFLVDSFEQILQKLSTTKTETPSPITLPSGVEMLRFEDPNGIPISFVIQRSIH